MLFVHGSWSLIVFAGWVFALIDVVTTDDSRCRRMGKGWWFVVVLLLLDAGALLWLVAGRPWGRAAGGTAAGSGVPRVPVPVPAESAEDFSRRCRDRAEEQRRRYREQQL